MAQVLVRQLEDRVVRSLKERAARNGNSLEQELREILTQAAKPSREEIRARMREIAARTIRPVSTEEILEAIREGRE